MTQALEQLPNVEAKLKEIKDQFSISLQYFYELGDNLKGDLHLEQCIDLVHSLKSTPGIDVKVIKRRLYCEVHSIYHTGKFSIRLV